MPTPAFYKQLVERYKNNQSSDEELQVFFHLLREGKLDDYLAEAMDSEAENSMQEYNPGNRKGIVRRMPVSVLLSVAAVLVLIVLAVYFTFFNASKTQSENNRITEQQRKQQLNDVPPAGNKASLILGDRRVIYLADIKNGHITNQGMAAVLKEAEETLTYNIINEGNGAAIFNTLITPRGGHYMVVLPDGTKAWLNAASSLRFPTAFSSTERRVFIEGEVYFEVAKVSTKPFKVMISDHAFVEVFGTHFNVNAYTDEPAVKVTLLEGAVAVNSGKQKVMLRPGQQARFTEEAIQVSNGVDTDQVIAWKNGTFQFNNEPIQSVMRQLARWYDVEVIYQGLPSFNHFGGEISRNTNLSEVIKILSESGVPCSVHDKKIIVRP